MRRKPKVRLICQVCSKEYLVKPYREHTSKYCCSLCGQKAKGKLGGAVKALTRGTGTKHRYVKLNGRHEHRVVAEKVLGRALFRWEIVHHIDGNGKNNTPENLQIMMQRDHIRIHRPDMMLARKQQAGY